MIRGDGIGGGSGGDSIQHLVKMLSQLPGLGPRSARRLVLYMLQNRDTSLRPLVDSLQRIDRDICQCHVCYNLDVSDPCGICSDQSRDGSQLCIVEQVSDLWALERGKIFKGYYHVLGGVLSAIDGVTPDSLGLHILAERCRVNNYFREIILATNLTIEGQTTAHYIGDLLKDLPLKVTRLAHGVPAGGELDYLDDGTLSAALRARQDF